MEQVLRVDVEPAGREPAAPPGGWERVTYEVLPPFEGALQVVKVFVPRMGGFARCAEVGPPLTEACFPRGEFSVN